MQLCQKPASQPYICVPFRKAHLAMRCKLPPFSDPPPQPSPGNRFPQGLGREAWTPSGLGGFPHLLRWAQVRASGLGWRDQEVGEGSGRAGTPQRPLLVHGCVSALQADLAAMLLGDLAEAKALHPWSRKETWGLLGSWPGWGPGGAARCDGEGFCLGKELLRAASVS